jgi:hypothetical protein
MLTNAARANSSYGLAFCSQILLSRNVPITCIAHRKHQNQLVGQAMKNRLFLLLAYVSSFLLGACIDIIRHSYDRILPAVQSSQIDGTTTQRIIIATLLIVVVIGGVYWGSRWSGQKYGVQHRTGLQALFVLTPIVVYILEH